MYKSLALLALLALIACGSTQTPKTTPGVSVTLPDPPAEPPPPRPDAHVLMINGGGNPRINYRSHLLHLDELHGLLVTAGIEPGRITVLASDGDDRTPDLATREVQPEPDFWRLSGTPLEPRLRTPITTVDSQLAGVELKPASRANLTHWFEDAAKRLRPGDTLVVYVTDHGTRHGPDPLDNRITLWGKDEWISVRQLRDLVATLDPGVRVVALMSQCFSGGFTELATAHSDDAEPNGNVCGYFASTADRPAYGCFPENFGVENVGHAFEFVRGLEQTGSFEEAHDRVLINDTTPDVPLRTSDAYLESLVRKDAQRRGIPFETRADELIRQALQDPAEWEPETRLLDRIAQATGSFSPRSFAELNELSERLPEIEEQLDLVTKAWRSALADANGSNLERFVEANPQWAERLTPSALARLRPEEKRSLTQELLASLETFTESDSAKHDRIRALHQRGESAKEASYRMDVRLAVVLRMRVLLASLAGRALVAQKGMEKERATLEGLDACERFELPRLGTDPPPKTAGAPESANAYPPFEDDLALTRASLPGWMGIRFNNPTDTLRKRYDLPRGAALVAHVYPDSPAKASGLAPGDIVTGPPGEPFTSHNQIRAWTMLSEIGKPGHLEILRSGQKKRITLTPDPFPMKWPSLPGPVKPGDDAPIIGLDAFRGPVRAQIQRGKNYILFFWATWCGPCKAAVPELLALEKSRGVPVIAVTDEDSKTLQSFLAKYEKPFPRSIAMDPLRKAFIGYGVGGTPTFVLVDPHGKVLWHQVGYIPNRGLSLPDWTWDKR